MIRIIYFTALCLCFIFISIEKTSAKATDKITVYFNHYANTAVATGPHAIFCGGALADTLVSYINRAKYTMDIAVYDYIQTTTFANIATAVNNAYSRGVKVRWIYDGSQPNTGLTALNSSIHTLPRPSGAGIMHNKFMIVDANSTTATDAFVWTGSTNWDASQFHTDYNNAIVIWDQTFAKAYTTEFNQMWGSTTLTPSASNAKFGAAKSNITPHTFTIGGATVESYFSPSDGTNSHILSTINSAKAQLFFGVYTFTEDNDASAIVTRKNAGVETYGIVDQISEGNSAYTTLRNALGSNLTVYVGVSPYVYHSKFVITDACNLNTDPKVLTGSHNWTSSADTQNDENTVIIHDATIANLYYQEFSQNFSDISGTALTPCKVVAVNDLTYNEGINIYPNPFSSASLHIDADFSWMGGHYEIYEVSGKLLAESAIETSVIEVPSMLTDGVYIIRFISGEKSVTRKLISLRQ